MGLIRAEDLPKPEEKLEIFRATIETLMSAGYVFIGMDHFAKPEDEMAMRSKRKNFTETSKGIQLMRVLTFMLLEFLL